MASSYITHVKSYQVTVHSTKRGRKIVKRSNFESYTAAMRFLDLVEAKYAPHYIVEFNTIFSK